MDTIAFIVGLFVAILVIAWYAFNEERAGAGGIGLFAIRSDAGGGDETAPPEAVRYRPRERVSPASGAGLRTATPTTTYRVKPAKRAPLAVDEDGTAEADKEY